MAETPSSGGRVGVAMAGDPFDPAAWSGIPSGLSGGIREQGAEPVPLDALPGAQVRYPVMAAGLVLSRDRLSAGNSSALHRLASRNARRVIARAPELEGVVQLGTEFSLPPGVRYVNLLDMTVAQAHLVHPHFASASRRTMRAWMERQRAIFHRARGCCVAGRWAAESLRRDYDIPAEKIHVVGWGANHVIPTANRDWSPPRYLFVGREWERKNGSMVLAAFSRLRREIPEAGLDLVGDHPQVDDPGVTDHGRLQLDRPAERAQLEDLFRRATCFVMPSLCEPFAIAYIEAATASLPIIGSTVGGCDEIVGRDAGVLVDPGDQSALLEAMRELADPARAAEAGAAGARRASEFTWEKVAARVLSALLDEP